MSDREQPGGDDRPDGVDTGYVLRRTGLLIDRVFVPIWFTLNSLGLLVHYLRQPESLWPDAHIYFRATETWLAGGNPWEAHWLTIRFAAPPPALLLNLPLIPFGENAAVIFWVSASALAVLFLLRRLHLRWWWIAFYPIFEGFTAATPDLVLAALVMLGAGGVAGLVKPYSVPALLADSRWRAIAVAALAGVVTVPVLPWSDFFAQRAVIQETFDLWGHPMSALGHPFLMMGVIVALILLGRERGLGLTTPGLLAQQPHYAVFSLEWIPSSRILIVGMATTASLTFAYAVVIYAVWERRSLFSNLMQGPQPNRAGH